MRILVLSDSHIPLAAKDLPPAVWKELEECTLCLHAGDWVSGELLKKLSAATKLHGVSGNMDDFSIKKKLPTKEVLTVEGVTIGLTHGGGNPAHLLQYIQGVFGDEFTHIDVFVFGHSHNPINEKVDGKLYFNPGSTTDKIFAPYLSYGILEVTEGTVKGEIVKIG